MNNRQTIRHVLTLVLSFSGVAWVIFHYQFTAHQVAYAAGITTLLMGGALFAVMSIGAAVATWQRKRGVQ